MASKKKEPTPVIVDELNDGWAHTIVEGGQGELVQVAGGNGNGNGHQPAGAPAADPDVWATLGTPLLVPIDSIQPNPYQPRTSEDPAAIAEIALSIYRNGLMQIPAARANGALFQLAFGHTRFAAFGLLATKGLPEYNIAADQRFALMPLRIVELDDQQMFEVAVAENIKRRELNPMEQAAAMQAYMSEFKASSRQAAELFGVNDATVRGSVRLLKLPVPVQEKIATGEITQTVARKLLAFSRIANESTVASAATEILRGNNPDYIIKNALRANKAVIEMWSSWQDKNKPLAGRGLWPLADEIESDLLARLTVADIVKVIKDESTPKTRLKYYFEELAGGVEADQLIKGNPDDADSIEMIELLRNPPRCTMCPLHVVLDGAHYCGLKTCHSRKSRAYIDAEIQKITKRLNIPVYDKQLDGPFVALETWPHHPKHEEHAELVKQKSPHLRLLIQPSPDDYKWTNSPLCRIVMIGDEAKKIAEAAQAAEEKQKTESKNWETEYKAKQKIYEAGRRYMDDELPGVFAQAFSGMNNVSILCALTRENCPKDAEKQAALLPKLRVSIARSALGAAIEYDVKARGPNAIAKRAVKIAAAWGVELPADFLEIAKTYEPVSTETPKKAKATAAAVEQPDEDDIDDDLVDEEDLDDDDNG